MKMDQIIIRPEAGRVLVQHTDNAGRSGTTLVECRELNSAETAALEACLGFCNARLPKEPENPVPGEVEQEIAELEYRLGQLKEKLRVEG